MNKDIVDFIEEEILVVYDNNSELLKDNLKNLDKVNELTIILDEAVTGRYLFDIENDNNDPFIMDHTRIITDKSFNCSAEFGSSRTLEQETSMHFNGAIADKALQSILNGDNTTVIWSFLSVDETLPWYNEVKELKYVDLSVLKDLFIKYNGDIRVLETFEFLTPYYIYRYEDLYGNDLINPMGQKNKDTYQLITVQGFNIIDVLERFGDNRVVEAKYHEIQVFLYAVKIVTVLILGIVFILLYIISKQHNKEIAKSIK